MSDKASNALVTFTINIGMLRKYLDENKDKVPQPIDLKHITDAVTTQGIVNNTITVPAGKDFQYRIACDYQDQRDIQNVVIYVPKVGHLSYETGNWFINKLDFDASEVEGYSAYGSYDTLEVTAKLANTFPNEKVNFSLHFMLLWTQDAPTSSSITWKEGIFCKYDPVLQVGHAGGDGDNSGG